MSTSFMTRLMFGGAIRTSKEHVVKTKNDQQNDENGPTETAKTQRFRLGCSSRP